MLLKLQICSDFILQIYISANIDPLVVALYFKIDVNLTNVNNGWIICLVI